MLRSHELGNLSIKNLEQTVTISGWVSSRRDHGGIAFLDMRDASGIAQVVIKNEDITEDVRNEYVLKIVGKVAKRPAGNENDIIKTGEIEIIAEEVTVLNISKTLPFQLSQHTEVGEEVRLKHRYLDLRRPNMAKNMFLRSEANRVAREELNKQNYIEIETPTLTRSTPEGARDFLVPARLAPGSWYALPQSPQLFKQLLQVAGFEKYYQIARCYRDEDFRADRQPEFTQLDIEASFVEQEDIIVLAEKIIQAVWKLIDVQLPKTFPHITYEQAMSKYGSDKPDLRFDLQITELTTYFKDTEFRVFKAPYVGAIVMPKGASQARKQLDAWQEWAKQRGAKGLAYVLVKEDGELAGPVAKNLTEKEKTNLAKEVCAKPGDCIFFAAGQPQASKTLLGAVRAEIGRRCELIDENSWSFVWVVDAPMFAPATEAIAAGDVTVGTSAWTAVHHAFTAPKPEFLDNFDIHPEKALSYAYDIVCNGNEIGGGSIRIHQAKVQERVFKVMGLEESQIKEKFGFLLEGFQYGAPPHGGIAFGWDRIVALLAKTETIRDVIAFPKSGGGYDPLTKAPANITLQQRKDAGVDIKIVE